MLREKRISGFLPFAVVATLARAGALLIKCRLTLTVTGDDVLATLAR